MGVWARVCLLGARLIGSGPFVARRLCAAFKFNGGKNNVESVVQGLVVLDGQTGKK